MIDQTEIEKLSFESAMAQLEQIISQLEAGNVELAQSITIYERGELLKKHCNNLLNQAALKIEKIKVTDDNKIITTAVELNC